MLPLDGIKVIDLTRLLPGEYCSLMLADFGADVIKVEDTGRGDYARWTHPMICDTMVDDTISAYFMVLNRNKMSMRVNLKAPEGKEIFLKLTRDADVVLESFRPGVMDRLGVGYRSLQQINPEIIYCALSGYGQDGPYKDLPGHDINYLAIAGVLGMQGLPGGPPVLSGVQMADICGGGQNSFAGILLALLARGKTGKGQFVDISMLDGAVSLLGQHAGNFFGNAIEPQRGRMNLNGGYACFNVYRAGDGKYLVLAALEEKFWAEYCRAIGKEALIDEQYADLMRQTEIAAELQTIFDRKPCDEWIEYFKQFDTCVTAVNEFKDAFCDPQVLHRKMIQSLTYQSPDGEKTIKQLGIPIKLSDTPGSLRTGPPRLGQHTDEILAGLGYSAKDIELLHQKGVC
ncbi:MAG: CaiB/BaiF CoA-transferase family protein [Syntrophobacteraceae bacterium]|jgi:crotonobetainyl-CoA:carnitine CoA-transferase CaiB-like acyl-CoA transferase